MIKNIQCQETQQEIELLEYECDFDNTDGCGGTVFRNSTTSGYEFKVDDYSPLIGSYFITDVSSISI